MPTHELPADLIGQAGLYNVGDPLLRRLRLEDQHGAPLTDLSKAFHGAEVVILYAGSAQGSNNLRSFHRELSALAQRERSTRVIYVSTDTDAKLALASAAQYPWLRMLFFDDSDFAPMQVSVTTDVVEVARGEDFVQASEIEVGAETVPYGGEDYIRDYVRPLSRAAVAMSMNAYSTPSIAVYHIPTHRFIARNVRPGAFSSDRIGKNLHTWRNGGTPGLRVADVARALRVPLFFLLLAALYQLVVQFGGEQYNVLPGLIDQFSWRSRELKGDQI
ncbi:uncharacterized protein LOC62_05G007021 [Vanrija pseudolonga]|uniref:Thioredoxin-like fold domain-containing protein n=1 Tax=Vanrija pseudolonga TaxID=143232 RepID=A0AAF1BJI8_9TREE|nr:hypothetical protein LOC62_05G007021 [Vanrija pseudolonga]